MLYFVGVGPGDPELITMKAVRILQEAAVIVLPDSGRDSVVWKIIEKWVKDKPVYSVSIPMHGMKQEWHEAHRRAAEHIRELMKEYETAAYPVLGDPGIYASGSYLMKHISAHYPCSVIPGVPAMCAAAAELGIPLCEQHEDLWVTDTFDAILQHADAALTAGVAGIAVADFLIADENLFYCMTGILCAAHKFIAENIGVSTFSRAAGKNQDLLVHNRIPPLLAEGSEALHLRRIVVGKEQRLFSIQCGDGLHIGLIQREIEYIEVLFHALSVRGLRDDHHVTLHQIAKRDLRGGLAVLFGDGEQRLVGEHAVLAFCERSPCHVLRTVLE